MTQGICFEKNSSGSGNWKRGRMRDWGIAWPDINHHEKILQFKLGYERALEDHKMTFCNMMCGNVRQKIPIQYLRLGPFAHKNFKILSSLTREKVR